MFNLQTKYGAVALTGALLLLGACQNQSVQPESNPLNSDAVHASARKNFSISEGNALLEDVARVVARSFDEKGFRQLVKEEAGKRFDGDYDILFREFAKKNGKDGKNIKQKLVTTADAFSQQLGKEAKYLSNQLAKAEETFPQLNIAVPVNFDKWNADLFSPLVAVRSLDYNEGVTQHLKAFDGQGNVRWIDAVAEPNEPVIVIGMNERVKVDAAGNISFKETQLRLEAGKQPSNARAAATLDGCH